MNATDLLDDMQHYQLQTEHGRIDLLASIGEMHFDQVWRNRVEAEIEGVTVCFISRRDLIENKRQVGRKIDFADVEALELLAGDRDPQLPE